MKSFFGVKDNDWIRNGLRRRALISNKLIAKVKGSGESEKRRRGEITKRSKR
jgi:hypothetical protein